MRGSVCIVSPGNLSSNPRLVKEASALHDADFDVTTVTCAYNPALKSFDDEIAANASWSVLRVPRLTGERYLNRGARLLAQALGRAGLGVPMPIAANASGGPTSALHRAARRVRADLYIAHYVAALPAATAAARRHGAMLGFDAEDFHSGEGGDGEGERLRMKMVETVEAASIPACSHVTAASPLIGQAYAARYGISPRTVLNVFPLKMAPAGDSVRSGDPRTLRAYWFSQTIGPDRGLQAFLAAMAAARTRISLDIRGSNRWGHGDRLMAMARELGVADRVNLLPMAPPHEMIRLAAAYDLGLSLETEVSENRRLCLTNKIFTYLLAGVPTMLSDTPAQRALAPDLGKAAMVVSLADRDRMARELDRLAMGPDALAEARAEAWRLGRQRYNWDVEKNVLVEAVAAAFERHARRRT
jgi:glycosyltransferase involved in cell wall biosynthesis